MTDATSDDVSAASEGESRQDRLYRLKQELTRHPSNMIVRRELVGIYRELGNIDQAGRFAVALPSGAKPDELRAYTRMLVSLRADEQRARDLSLIVFGGKDLPLSLRDSLRKSAKHPVATAIGWVAAITLIGTAALSVVALLAVYGMATAGAEDTQMAAGMWNFVLGWMALAGMLTAAIWRAARRRWTSAFVFFAIAVVLAVPVTVASMSITVS